MAPLELLSILALVVMGALVLLVFLDGCIDDALLVCSVNADHDPHAIVADMEGAFQTWVRSAHPDRRTFVRRIRLHALSRAQQERLLELFESRGFIVVGVDVFNPNTRATYVVRKKRPDASPLSPSSPAANSKKKGAKRGVMVAKKKGKQGKADAPTATTAVVTVPLQSSVCWGAADVRLAQSALAPLGLQCRVEWGASSSSSSNNSPPTCTFVVAVASTAPTSAATTNTNTRRR